MLYISMCRSKVLGKGGKVKGVISVSWPNVLWFMIHLPHPQRPSGSGRVVSQEEAGRRWVGGVRTGFLCLLFNGPTQRTEHTQLPADCTLWEERALFVEEVGSILAVRSPFLSLDAGSQQALHIHSPSSLLRPASVAQPWARYFWILVPSLFQVGNGQVVSAFSFVFLLGVEAETFAGLGVCLQDAGP